MTNVELHAAGLSMLHIALTCDDSDVSAAADVVLAWIERKLSPTLPPTSPVTPSGTDGVSTARSGHLSSATGT